MRLLELEIHCVRGIPHLLLKPNGKNFVVWGPNGSGKSAVVDAIDFLLTGRISRLVGKGTGGITLSQHGPHIDHEPEEAIVRAVVQLPGLKEPVELERCMAHAATLKYEKSVASHLKPIITIAQRGQYVLTRRDILKYITAEAGTRAQEIQELLNITEIEAIRKALVRAENDLDKELQAAKRDVDKAKGAVNATVQEKTFHRDVVLKVVNQNRAVLGGNPISILHSTQLKAQLPPPAVAARERPINVALLERDIQNLTGVMSSQNQKRVGKTDQELRSLLKTIRSDPQLLRSLSQVELTELGITLIDETGSCPLCDTPWPPGKLREHLEQKLSVAQVATQHQQRVTELAEAIANSANATTASLHKVIAAAQLADLKEHLPTLQLWLSSLQRLSSILSVPLQKYPDPHFGSNQIQQMVAPVNVSVTLAQIHSAIKAAYPETTPEQSAWDTLTRLEENLKALEAAEHSFKSAELYQKRAYLLLKHFQRSRDTVLGKLYDDIRDRFVGLYRQLHGPDEDGFTARLEPEGAGLAFEVDFYERGTHPPHALHSEGHQDSMGLCLYLALAERLSAGLIELVILDDVVMSVDADHRRNLCSLLSECFPDRQFLITTHDRTWANQLKSEGIVGIRETLHFCNWSIDSGPEVYYVADIMWGRIDTALKEDNVPSAAAQLRRGSEEFFGMVCDTLQVPVIYKLSGQCEFGDLLLPAMEQYRRLLKRAQKAARSWDNNEDVLKLQEIDSIRSEVYKRTFAEQWAVNPNVHYNSWANFSPQDFRPVVEAFQDLYALFVCSNCGGMLRLATVDRKIASVRCNCGKVNWNLVEKDESS
jgi:energy-coupling factor transporter ATP-binding protein EcfA2